MNIFQRGDYRAFIVVAPADNIDRALYAFPVFEGERVSDVFAYYQSLYIDTTAKVSLRSTDMDEDANLGRVFADVKWDGNKFFVSTITPRKALWLSCVTQWEDQWVFDHLAASQNNLPNDVVRVFKGGREVQNWVNVNYVHYITMYAWAALTAFAAWAVMSSSIKDRN